jgi:predicted peroxiredoxin
MNKIIKKSSVIFALCMMLISGSVMADSKGLFIDLSSDDLFKVRRALTVGTMVRNLHKVPVLVNISLGATRYVDSGFPIASMAKLRGESVHDLMNKFMSAGGEIYVCPMCLQGNGVDKADMLKGVEIGGPSTTLSRLMADDVKVLSY